MAIEIERKFVVKKSKDFMNLLRSWKKSSVSVPREKIRQGYLKRQAPSIRIRHTKHLSEYVNGRVFPVSYCLGYITVKGKAKGISRKEYDMGIDECEALDLLKMCSETNPESHIIQKTRYHYGRWEVDVFEKENTGLIIAEIELVTVKEQVEVPDWAWLEVSDNPMFGNAELSWHPVCTWTPKQRTVITHV